MMHLLLATRGTVRRGRPPAGRGAGDLDLAAAVTTADPAVQRVELSVGDATLKFTADEVRDVMTALVS